MDVVDLTSGGYVYQWTFVAGHPRCVEDAIVASDPGAVPALQRNAAIRAVLAPTLDYEAAQALVARGQPENGEPRKIPEMDDEGKPVLDENGQVVMVDNPAWELLPLTVVVIDPMTGEQHEAPAPRWVEYDAAVDLILTASPVTKALALWRTPEPADGNDGRLEWLGAQHTVENAVDIAAEEPLAIDPRPNVDEISDRQFAHALAKEGTISEAEALAFVKTGDLPTALEAAVDMLPEEQRFDARMFLSGATLFYRLHPMTSAICAVLNKSPLQRDDFFRFAGTL